MKTSRGARPGEMYRLHQCRQIELLKVETICARCVRRYLSNKSVNDTVASNKSCTAFHHSTTFYKALSYVLSRATYESENICFIIPLDFGSVGGYECVRLTVIFTFLIHRYCFLITPAQARDTSTGLSSFAFCIFHRLHKLAFSWERRQVCASQ